VADASFVTQNVAPLNDALGFSTAFEAESEGELLAFLGSIHSDWVLALNVVLALFVRDADRSKDAAGMAHAEALSAALLTRVTQLAWDRASALAKQADGGRKGGVRAHQDAKGSDPELRAESELLTRNRVPPHKLTSTILDRHGERFGKGDYLRRRLQGLGYVPRRTKAKKPT
jgi:hypothetical protein